MRSASTGGLRKMPTTALKARKSGQDASTGRALKTVIAWDRSRATAKECRTNKYAVPRHSAKRSTEDSVSSPVRKELSQRSSPSDMAQMKHVIRTTETAIFDVLDPIDGIVQPARQVRKPSSGTRFMDLKRPEVCAGPRSLFHCDSALFRIGDETDPDSSMSQIKSGHQRDLPHAE